MSAPHKISPKLLDLQIIGGRLVKPFNPSSKDKYLQCVADIGLNSVKILPFADESVTISVDGRIAESGETIEIVLKSDGYGYRTVTVKTTLLSGEDESEFVLAILKPAPDIETLYELENRPQFHYSAPYGYINDPNGMVYNAQSGEYHLFYQAYPYSQKAISKHWGHATSKDLVTFTELPTALYPDDNGSMWSGTAIVDYENMAKLYDESTPPSARILLVYYAWNDWETGAGLAYTPDGGISWVKAHDGRLFNFIGAKPGHVDPKVFWNEKLKKWLMFCASGNIYTSSDLWNWTYKGFDRAWECPDIYQIKVEETGETKFVRTYGGTHYSVGDIVENADGTIKFIALARELPYNGDSLDRSKSEGILREYGWFSGKSGTCYAVQHYAHAPNDRIISVSWMIERGLDTSDTWAGAMSVATQQKLRQKSGGSYLLYSYPVDELKALRGKKLYSASSITITPAGANPLVGINALYADIDATFILDSTVSEIGFKLRTGEDSGDITVKYDTLNQLLIADYSNSKHAAYNGVRSMKMELPNDRRISMRVLLDSIIVESFGNYGEASISSVFSRDKLYTGMELFVAGGNAVIEAIEIYQMKSAWKK